MILSVCWMIFLFVLTFYFTRLYRTRQIIRDADGSPYLIRYFVYRTRNKNRNRVYLHHIVRSDHDRALHNHPFEFVSFILWGGYWEVADMRQIPDEDQGWFPGENLGEMVKWFPQFSLLRRGLLWKHRLIVPEGKSAWTLVFRTGKKQEWGFFPNGFFCHNTKYDIKTGLCEEE